MFFYIKILLNYRKKYKFCTIYKKKNIIETNILLTILRKENNSTKNSPKIIYFLHLYDQFTLFPFNHHLIQ